jgi:hypothetical protein
MAACALREEISSGDCLGYAWAYIRKSRPGNVSSVRDRRRFDDIVGSMVTIL